MAASAVCPTEWAALLDALCEHFVFATEALVVWILTAAQGDAHLVAECLSELPPGALFQVLVLARK